MSKYTLIELKDVIVTHGVNKILGKEFSIKKGNYSNEDVALVIDYVLNYVETSGATIKNRQTFGCGSWMFQFVFNDIYIELHELKDTVGGENVYGFGLTYTIKIFKEQIEFCRVNMQQPNFPRLGQKIIVSPEIYDGAEVNAVRYPSPDHMTGWWMTSNSYNGDIKSLLIDHLFHLLKARPDLVKFLALPFGFRFYKDNVEEGAWFDEEALKINQK
jgi:hypothetical protein